MLFRPFSRGDLTRGRSFSEGGSGLGLAISRRLAEQLGGTLDARTELGRGSVLTLAIPAQVVEAALPFPSETRLVADRGMAASASPPVPPRVTARVLVAEDNHDNQRVIALRLMMAGADVEIAPNGQAAVDLACAARDADRPFELVLMDMQMPILDGYEATRVLRSQGFHMPIIALTAHAMPEDRLECLRFGCDEYVSKPIDWDSLLVLLAGLLARPVTTQADPG